MGGRIARASPEEQDQDLVSNKQVSFQVFKSLGASHFVSLASRDFRKAIKSVS